MKSRYCRLVIRPLPWLGLCVLLTGLVACSRYQVTLNEGVLYDPPTLLTRFETEDARLKSCLDQAIEDGGFTEFGQVTRLICSYAGLTSLKGIESFPNLRQLNLEHNQLRSLQPLKHLARLEVLKLNDNRLQQVPELLTLPHLKAVQLHNNPELECRDLQQLQQDPDRTLELQLPEQCQSAVTSQT